MDGDTTRFWTSGQMYVLHILWLDLDVSETDWAIKKKVKVLSNSFNFS